MLSGSSGAAYEGMGILKMGKSTDTGDGTGAGSGAGCGAGSGAGGRYWFSGCAMGRKATSLTTGGIYSFLGCAGGRYSGFGGGGR